MRGVLRGLLNLNLHGADVPKLALKERTLNSTINTHIRHRKASVHTSSMHSNKGPEKTRKSPRWIFHIGMLALLEQRTRQEVKAYAHCY